MNRPLIKSSWIGEGALIVGSILLALTAEALWNNSQERAAEKELLATVYSELLASKDDLQREMGMHTGDLNAATKLLEYTTSQDMTVLPAETAAWPFYLFSTTNLDTGALNGALASGQLDNVSNLQLKARLGAWPSVVAEFVEEEARAARFVDSIRPVVSPYIQTPRVMDALGSESPLPEIATAESIQFLKSIEGQNLASVRVSIESSAMRDAERLLNLIEELLDLIETELNLPPRNP